MILTENKIEVTHQMMDDEGLYRMGQYGIPIQKGEILGITWESAIELTEEDLDHIEAYFLTKLDSQSQNPSKDRLKREYIMCAATWFSDLPKSANGPSNIDRGTVVCGFSHAHIISIMKSLTGLNMPQQGPYTEGFLTSNNRFVGRGEAGKIAMASGRVKQLSYFGGRLLDSSDLHTLPVKEMTCKNCQNLKDDTDECTICDHFSRFKP